MRPAATFLPRFRLCRSAALVATGALLISFAAAGCEGEVTGAIPDGPRGASDGPVPSIDAPGDSDDAAVPADATPGDRAGPGIKPTADNTGVPAGVDLMVIDHDVVLDEDGAMLDAVDVHGTVTIAANQVRVTRSIIRGRELSGNGAALRIDSGEDIVVEDVQILPSVPTVFLDSVWASGATLRRMDIQGGVDGIKAGSSTTIEYSYIHDMTSFDSDPNQGGGATHNDAIQILSGSVLRITGNNLVVTTDQNAAIQVTQDFGEVSDLVIAQNWADGGGCTFNFSHNGGDSLAVTTRDNRFGRGSFYDCPILKSTQTTLDSAGDVFDDTGEPVPVQTHD